MMGYALTKKEIKTTIRVSVREVLNEERMHIQSILLPDVSEKEQKDIEHLYGMLSRKTAKSRKLEL